jgi:hypothetical protein
MFDNPTVQAILIDVFWTLAYIGIVVALVAGLMLAFAPAQALRFAEHLNREFSFGWLRRLLDEPRRADPFFYRHHYIVGVVLIAATLYFYWAYATSMDAAALAAIYAGQLPAVVLDILAGVLMTVLVIGNGLGFALGVVMLVRPSLLKPLETHANAWTDTDRASDKLNRRDNRPEGMAHRYPRRLGVIILVATVYIGAVALFMNH